MNNSFIVYRLSFIAMQRILRTAINDQRYTPYQLAFLTPGIFPCNAMSRNIFLDTPK